MTYHLFIEGVAAGAQDVTQVASAIGARFGIDAAEITRRLAAGRFRVKSNVDWSTAAAFQGELERLGARCAIVDSSTGHPVGHAAAASAAALPPHLQNSAASRSAPVTAAVGTPVPRAPANAVPSNPALSLAGFAPPASAIPPRLAPAPSPAHQVTSPHQTPPAHGSAAGIAVPRTQTSQTAAGQSQYQSGLSAAMNTTEVAPEQLGALATGTFRLAALDETDDEATAFAPDPDATVFAPPSVASERSGPTAVEANLEPLPALLPLPPLAGEDAGGGHTHAGAPPPQVGARSAAPPPAPSRGPGQAPAPPAVDLRFLPPSEANSEDDALSLLVDPREERARKPITEPPVSISGTFSAVAAPLPAPAPASASATAAAAAAAVRVDQALIAIRQPRVLWAVGPVLGTLLGFALALAYARGKESTSFAEIDARVVARQQAALTPVQWDALEAMRSAELRAKAAEKQRIATTALILWLLVAGGVGFAWIRYVPWQSWVRSSEGEP